jgi:hypothetical protein
LLPFLVEAANDPAVENRAGIVRMIDDIAVTGNTAAGAAPAGDGRWYPHVDPAWPAAWDRAAPLLVPSRLDPVDVRAAKAAALGEAAGRADELIGVLSERCLREPDENVAGLLAESVGRLARHAVHRRDEALTWLRRLRADEGVARHDVRDRAASGLELARTGQEPGSAASDVRATETEAIPLDRELGAAVLGRVPFAHMLLSRGPASQRDVGLRLAASLMSRWRSAVPDLLPGVARRVDDAGSENRSLALRILAMCGPAARPFADRVAAHITEADEPDAVARLHAVWALARMGDDRCVAPLARMLTQPGSGFHNEYRYHATDRSLGAVTRSTWWMRSPLSPRTPKLFSNRCSPGSTTPFRTGGTGCTGSSALGGATARTWFPACSTFSTAGIRSPTSARCGACTGASSRNVIGNCSARNSCRASRCGTNIPTGSTRSTSRR